MNFEFVDVSRREAYLCVAMLLMWGELSGGMEKTESKKWKNRENSAYSNFSTRLAVNDSTSTSLVKNLNSDTSDINSDDQNLYMMGCLFNFEKVRKKEARF